MAHLQDPASDYLRSVRGSLIHVLPGGGPEAWRWELDDMAQDVLLGAVERGHALRRDPRQPWPELGLARHAFRTQARARRHSKLEHAAPESVLRYARDGGARPDAEAEREELRQRVRAAVDRLPQRRREVVTAVKLEGISVSAFAALQGKSIDAVRALLKRSILDLRRLLRGLDLG